MYKDSKRTWIAIVPLDKPLFGGALVAVDVVVLLKLLITYIDGVKSTRQMSES